MNYQQLAASSGGGGVDDNRISTKASLIRVIRRKKVKLPKVLESVDIKEEEEEEEGKEEGEGGGGKENEKERRNENKILTPRSPVLPAVPYFSQNQKPIAKNTNDINSNNSNNNVNTVKKMIKETDAFKKRLPDVFPPATHFKRALRNLKTIKADLGMKNLKNQQRKFTAQSMDAIMKGLTVPITEILDAYKKTLGDLHPFEATVADLTVTARVKAGSPDLTDILANLRQLRVVTSRTAKEFASNASNATSAVEAKQLLEDGLAELEKIYESPAGLVLNELVDMQKDLRRIPVVELDTPTVVLVGAPNVGKSSIVRAVSSGTPEVNDYPFTTRGVTIGHIVDESRDLRFQVMDTPGLLDRPSEERNEMERLTFASLAHLPTAVIFVIDPSGLSGEQSTLTAQLNVREGLKQRFPRRPWIDVVSKGDLDIPDDVVARLPPNHLLVSIHSGLNVNVLRQNIERMLFELQEILSK